MKKLWMDFKINWHQNKFLTFSLPINSQLLPHHKSKNKWVFVVSPRMIAYSVSISGEEYFFHSKQPLGADMCAECCVRN